MSKKSSISTYNKILWITVLTLFISVCGTTYVWADRLEEYALDDSNAIALTPVNLDEQQVMNIEVLPESAELTEEMTSTKDVVRYRKVSGNSIANSGFEVSDENTVWSMNTQVDIFKISYVNGQNEVTVNSNTGDKLIAPGTENSYTFKVKNTGNMPLTYELTVEAYFSPEGVSIPVEARLNRLDGDWLVGNSEEYAAVELLNGASDKGELRSGRLATYVLDWVWPFEGSDELDTLLGNRALDEDLTLTIVINTIAEIEPAPDTGDDSSLGMWMTLSGASLVAMILLFILKRREEESEQKKSEMN